jgi:hypothetical protein
MLAARKHEHDIWSRIQELFAVLGAVDLDFAGARTHNRYRARIALIGNLYTGGRCLGRTKIPIKVENPDGRLF